MELNISNPTGGLHRSDDSDVMDQMSRAIDFGISNDEMGQRGEAYHGGAIGLMAAAAAGISVLAAGAMGVIGAIFGVTDVTHNTVTQNAPSGWVSDLHDLQVAAVVIQDRAEIIPTPADDLEVGEVRLPHLVDCRGFVFELIGRFDHYVIRRSDQVSCFENAIS